MKVSFKKILNYSFVILVITSFSSCVKKDFDVPPTGGVDPEMTGTYTTIAALKALYTGTPVKITSDFYISGVVIADDQSGNFYKEIVLQDSTGGISINIDQSNYYTTYKIGRRVFVKCYGLTIGEYAKLIQLGSGVDNTGSLVRIASTLVTTYLLPGSYYHYVTPRTIHIGDITTANLDAYINTYQNTLIKIDTAEFAEQDTTFADGPLKQDRNLTIKDCNGKSIIIRSSGYATFATAQVPTGNGSVIAVLQIYNSFGANLLTDLQIKIRDLTDLTLTGLRCDQMPIGILDYLNQDFETQASNVDIGISGWLNTAVAGTRKWHGKYFSPNTYAEATAYGSGLSSMETWLITPRINLSKADTLTFESSQSYWVHDGLSVWISTNFDGTNVAAATWTQLPCSLAGSSNANYVFVPSGTIPLTAFSGIGYIGFKYTGSDPGQNTNYQIDNVIVH
jgi:hypothetical protein